MNFPCAHACAIMQATKINMKSKIDDRWANWATGSRLLSVYASYFDLRSCLHHGTIGPAYILDTRQDKIWRRVCRAQYLD